MSDKKTIFEGTISFINHEKHSATVGYTQNSKSKSMSFALPVADKNAKTHKYKVGDTIQFEIALTERGDRMTAINIKFLYNQAIEKLVQRGQRLNSFKGYMKLVDDKWFVKETESYLFFPLELSKWEQLPDNEEVTFSFTNIDKPNSLTAELSHSRYIPAFKTALQYYKDKTPVEAEVKTVTPYGVHINLIGEEVQAKLPVQGNEDLEAGNKVTVLITYLSKKKIAVERV